MLTNRNLAVKEYEQLIEEAIAQIPLYTKEWTNYNPSDPGITILENLTAFSALQQSEINTVTEKAKWKLLALAGFYPEKGKSAIAYLFNTLAKHKHFVDGQKIFAQNVCFEFVGKSEISGGKIEKIYLHNDKGLSNIYDLVHDTILPRGIELFCQKSDGESALYFCISNFRTIQGKASLYIDLKEEYSRTPLKMEDANPFAKGEWEIFTDEGFQHIDVEDETCCFLQKGYIHFHIPEDMKPIPVSKDKLYRIRFSIEHAQYDIQPRLERVFGLLTPICQRDTKSVILKEIYHSGMRLEHYLLQKGYLDVFVKEEDGLFYKYDFETSLSLPGKGREARWMKDSIFGGELILPQNAEGREVQIIVRDESIMPYRELGILYGYDNQEFALPVINDLSSERAYGDSISLIIVETNEKGQSMHIVHSDSQEDEEVVFSFNEEENTVTIIDCGRYEGARVYLGEYATYRGEAGNVLAGTSLFMEGLKEEYLSCGVGHAGHFRENFETVRRRFVTDIRHASTIVTASDCIQLVREIPGLSIHKVNAATMPDGNTIAVVVKPNSKEEFPKISDIYERAMMDFLEERRMLTTRIEIRQPIYIPVHVKVGVHIKNHYENCEEIIINCLREKLGGIDSEVNFGEVLSFREIHNCINELDCVEDITELTIFTDQIYGAKKVGKDIVMPFNALYYAGTLKIDLS